MGDETSAFLDSIRKTRSTHWKTTNSTVMTFAAKVKTLREDEKEWKKCVSLRVPNDFRTFSRLSKLRPLYRPFKKRRIIIHPIPGRATHGEAEFLKPFIDWEKVIKKGDV